MIGKKYIFAAVLASAPLATYAQNVYTFENVVAIEHRPNQVLITGDLFDDIQRRTITLPLDSASGYGNMYERCDRVFNVVLSQPAAYDLTVVTELLFFPGNPGETGTVKLVFTSCRANLKS